LRIEKINYRSAWGKKLSGGGCTVRIFLDGEWYGGYGERA